MFCLRSMRKLIGWGFIQCCNCERSKKPVRENWAQGREELLPIQPFSIIVMPACVMVVAFGDVL
jgi:hypothetical protein